PRSTTGNKPFYVSRNGLESLRHIFFCDGIKRYPVSEFLAVCRRQFLIKRQVFSNERLYQRVKFWRTFFITPPVYLGTKNINQRQQQNAGNNIPGITFVHFPGQVKRQKSQQSNRQSNFSRKIHRTRFGGQSKNF